MDTVSQSQPSAYERATARVVKQAAPLVASAGNPAKVPDRGRGIGRAVGSAGASVGIHFLVALVFGLMTWAVGTADDRAPRERPAVLVTDVPPLPAGGGFRFPGHALIDRPDSRRVGAKSDVVSELSRLRAPAAAEATTPPGDGDASLATLGGKEWARLDGIDPATGGGAGGGDSGRGSGLGDGELAGGGPVGSLWGVGEGQRARSIVYVMDRSASMDQSMELLKRELMQAIGSLEAEQLFDLLWFNEGRADDLFGRLRPATLENKSTAFDAIEQVIAIGRTEPLNAIRAALEMAPDVMFLLSDGDFGERNEEILRTIRRRNQNEATRINTILFIHDTVGHGEAILRRIAEDNGGVYKHVTEDDLYR